ncbi:MAG: hypothetical protein DRP29_08765 [Thermodesulfobacteriota bacterium]|nr:MAG: hypothetical protein DRP29_08765 [Thermodesulfobacteriota bacterium]
MKVIISDKLPRIIKAKKKLETDLNVQITNRGKEVTIKGTPENEYTAEKVIDAINLGFPLSTALLIKQEDYLLEVISIKDYTKRHDLSRVRARIIGTKGRTLATLGQLTKCFFEIKDNVVGIIGDPEYIKNAQEGIISLIKGAKQANVYSGLERNQPKPIIDLGLKEEKK